ncbi:metallophosphoesterase [Armatimonas sp.]|uniref:metallophosphoesterase n=1 Tax=Armatimonas sp. TaxID=1872638 RepID=UPI003752B4B8
MTRRELLRAAGGLSFLALIPAERGFALPGSDPAQPLFTALPYLQPGPHNDTSLIIAWQTDHKSASFTVKVEGLTEALTPRRTERLSGEGEDFETRFNYAVSVPTLAAGKRFRYQVFMDEKRIAEGWFTTQKPRCVKTRFVAFGDNSFGDISDRMIAYQAFKALPDFVLNTGDNVYEDGTDDEYARHFFPVYNSEIAGPRIGAPLLRSVPFYTVIANHDVHGKDDKKHPVADFTAHPDSLAYFTNMYLPENGLTGTFAPTLMGPPEPIAHFKTCAGSRFPMMSTYSFDYGDGHFLCLDSNLYVDPNDAALQSYIERDLLASSAPWKFVVFHHPCFNVGADHYAEQHMRVLAPIFERCGVAIVWHGHEHNYQRTVPLRFAPRETKGASNVGSKARLVPGTFMLDTHFDGKTKTKPSGVIYITTGAGGKHLYDSEWGQKAQTHPEDGNLDYIARFIADRHSLTVIEMDTAALEIKQVDQWGAVVDWCRMTSS